MMDLGTLRALNEFWQKQFDKRHPQVALRRKERERLAALGELPPVRKSRSKPSAKRTLRP